MDMVLAVMRVTGNSLIGKTDILSIEIAANCQCWEGRGLMWIV